MRRRVILDSLKGIPVREAPNGVYIYDCNTKLVYDPTFWKGSKVSNKNIRVALITKNCRFALGYGMVSLDGWGGENFIWGENGQIPGVPDLSETESRTHYDGVSDTINIVSYFGKNIKYAAPYCQNVVLEDGSVGYLGSVGEMLEIAKNYSAIKDATSKIWGSLGISGSIFYTSTQYIYDHDVIFGVSIYNNTITTIPRGEYSQSYFCMPLYSI